MAPTIRSRLADGDVTVFPLTSLDIEGGVIRIEAVSLRRAPQHALEFEIQMRQGVTADSHRSIRSVMAYRFATTPELDRVLDRPELDGGVAKRLEQALGFIALHPYYARCVTYVFDALFPEIRFPFEARVHLVEERPETTFGQGGDDPQAETPPTFRSFLLRTPAWLTRMTVNDCDRSARFEAFTFTEPLGREPAHLGFSMRIQGPDEDLRRYTARAWWNQSAFDQPVVPDAEPNLRAALEGLLKDPSSDPADPIFDALLKNPAPTWRSWVETRGLAALLQPRGVLATAESDEVSLTLRSRAEAMGTAPGERQDVFMDLELEVRQVGRPKEVLHAREKFGWFPESCDVPLDPATLAERPSVDRAANQVRTKIARELDALAANWIRRPDERSFAPRDVSLLTTLYSASRAVRATPGQGEPRPFRIDDDVTHKTFGPGTVVKVENPGPNARLTIRFSDGTKLLASKYVSHSR